MSNSRSPNRRGRSRTARSVPLTSMASHSPNNDITTREQMIAAAATGLAGLRTAMTAAEKEAEEAVAFVVESGKTKEEKTEKEEEEAEEDDSAKRGRMVAAAAEAGVARTRAAAAAAEKEAAGGFGFEEDDNATEADNFNEAHGVNIANNANHPSVLKKIVSTLSTNHQTILILTTIFNAIILFINYYSTLAECTSKAWSDGVQDPVKISDLCRPKPGLTPLFGMAAIGIWHVVKERLVPVAKDRPWVFAALVGAALGTSAGAWSLGAVLASVTAMTMAYEGVGVVV